jgi:hypothetical protein
LRIDQRELVIDAAFGVDVAASDTVSTVFSFVLPVTLSGIISPLRFAQNDALYALTFNASTNIAQQ